MGDRDVRAVLLPVRDSHRRARRSRDRFGSYDAPFVPMAILLCVGALLWFKIDASEELSAEPEVEPVPVAVG
jgi:hypothetical protein